MEMICRGLVYLLVLCGHPYLVPFLFTVLLSLHFVTYIFIVFLIFFSGRCMLELKFAICHRVANLSSQASSVDVYSLWLKNH